MRSVLAFIVLGATGCYSGVHDHEGGPGGAPGADDAGADDGGDDGADAQGADRVEFPTLATHGGLRRLTVAEYDNALADLVGDTSSPAAEFLPEDALSPFDNDYLLQAPSEALVLGVEKLAIEAAERLLADPDRLDALVGCPPAEMDVDCFREFVARFGRRAFRRTLEAEEVDAFASLHALGVDAGDGRVAAAAVVRAMLQDPNFLYRVEIGEPVDGLPGTVKLGDFEIATRLSFFLWGTIPDDELLDLAQDDGLSTAAAVRERASDMVADPRARAAVARFHALWLGYSRLGSEGLAADMGRESDALVERVVFDDEMPWLSLFESTQTFVTPQLAVHYGLPVPDDPQGGWVDYGADGRGGILSHATLLALGAKFDDTSPTVRGLQLRERLFCETIEVPPDLPVNTDDPPGVDPDACKWDRYAAHREAGACAGCHALLDGLGFGLENYDSSGVFRTHDVGKPECEISGDGEVTGVGTFNGPAELGRLLVDVPAVETCAVRQLYRFAAGRTEPDDLDLAFLAALRSEVSDQAPHLQDLMVRIAASEAFRFRVIEEEG